MKNPNACLSPIKRNDPNSNPNQNDQTQNLTSKAQMKRINKFKPKLAQSHKQLVFKLKKIYLTNFQTLRIRML